MKLPLYNIGGAHFRNEQDAGFFLINIVHVGAIYIVEDIAGMCLKRDNNEREYK